MLVSQVTIACSCIAITNPCDHLINEYSSPVLVHIDKMVNNQIAEVTIKDISDKLTELKKDYVIVADSRTSCGTSIGHLSEGDNYFFGFPLYQLENDTIYYYQCMSPFYELGKFSQLINCINKSATGKLFLFPNPVRDNVVTIQNRLLNPVRLSIYNTTGKLIDEQGNLDEYRNEIELPDDLPNGIYIVRIQSGTAGVVYSSKLVVAR